jgi:hypothetical protein
LLPIEGTLDAKHGDSPLIFDSVLQPVFSLTIDGRRIVGKKRQGGFIMSDPIIVEKSGSTAGGVAIGILLAILVLAGLFYWHPWSTTTRTDTTTTTTQGSQPNGPTTQQQQQKQQTTTKTPP